MDITTFKKVFVTLNIDMIYEKDRIREKTEDDEAYYGLQFEDSICHIYSYQRGKMQVKYEYKNKDEALKYFMIYIVKKYIIKKYVNPILNSNLILYDQSVTYNDIITVFNKNNIQIQKFNIYSLELTECNEQYILSILNIKRKKIYRSPKMEKSDALFVFFRWGCILYNFISIINMFNGFGIKIDVLKDREIISMLTMN